MLKATEVANACKCQRDVPLYDKSVKLTDITDICPPSCHENSVPESVGNPKEQLNNPCYRYANQHINDRNEDKGA